MSVITRMRKQVAIYWAPNAKASKQGNPTWTAPVEITCRWVDKRGTVMTDKGETLVYTSKVYVSIDVEPRGMLKLGDLDTAVLDPRVERAIEIQWFEKTPNFKATEFLRTAYLV